MNLRQGKALVLSRIIEKKAATDNSDLKDSFKGLGTGIGTTGAALPLMFPAYFKLYDDRITDKDRKEFREFVRFAKDKEPSLKKIDIINMAVREKGGPHYNRTLKRIRTWDNVGVFAHEAGHAINDSKKFSLQSLPNHRAWLALQAPMLSKKVRDKIGGQNKESFRYKAVDLLRRHPGLAYLAATSPNLLEEVLADVRGLALMRVFAKYKKMPKPSMYAIKNLPLMAGGLLSHFGDAAMKAGAIDVGANLYRKLKDKETAQ